MTTTIFGSVVWYPKLFSKENQQDSTQNISEIPNGISSPQKKSLPPSSPPKSGADLVQALPIEEDEGNLLGWFPTSLNISTNF